MYARCAECGWFQFSPNAKVRMRSCCFKELTGKTKRIRKGKCLEYKSAYNVIDRFMFKIHVKEKPERSLIK